MNLNGSEKFYHETGHVITAKFLGGVLCEQIIKQIFHYGDTIYSLLLFECQFLDQRLIIRNELLKDSITANDQELIFSASIKLLYIWFARDELLIIFSRLILLMKKISKTSGQV